MTAIYVDPARWPYRGMKMCHMVADDPQALHALAAALGLAPAWYHDGHYNLCRKTRARAIGLGAIAVSGRVMGLMIRHRRETGFLGDPASLLSAFEDRRARTVDQRGAVPISDRSADRLGAERVDRFSQ